VKIVGFQRNFQTLLIRRREADAPLTVESWVTAELFNPRAIQKNQNNLNSEWTPTKTGLGLARVIVV
jgi:hypothetical protein